MLMNWNKLGNITLLVAEDDAFNRKLISMMLSRNEKINVVEASDGQEALSLLELNQIDALLLDIHMPNIDGFEVLSIIRNNQKYKDFPIIVITSDEVEKKRSFSLGANAFLPKPFRQNELEKQVYNLFVKE